MVASVQDEIASLEGSVKACYERLKADVATAQQTLDEAELRLDSFRARMLSQLQVASANRSAQKQRAERRATVDKLLAEGLTRTEIVRRTGLVDHLVGYDIDCIRRKRRTKGLPERVGEAKNDVGSNAGEDQNQRLYKPVGDDKAPKDEKSDLSDQTEENDEDETSDGEAGDIDDVDDVDEDSEDEEDGEDENVKEAQAEPASVAPRGPTPGKGAGPAGPQASRSDLKEEAKRRLRTSRKIAFLTTWDNGHRHKVQVDTFGDGRTLPDALGHGHRFCRFEAIDNIDHKHGLTLDPVT
jgi:hypothetical protein